MTQGCEEFRERLHDWIDRALEPAERRSTRGHLDACAACRSELAALERLRAATDRLPRSVAPPRDLWPTIEPRLALPWWRRLAPIGRIAELWPPRPIPAAVAAALALTLGLWLWRDQPAPPADGSPAAIETASWSAEKLHAQAELARSEDGMLLARRDLLEAVERRQGQLAPDTVAILQENMHIIDQAIGQIRFALDDDPLNHQLHRQLAAQYQQEVQLLKRVSGV